MTRKNLPSHQRIKQMEDFLKDKDLKKIAEDRLAQMHDTLCSQGEHSFKNKKCEYCDEKEK